MNTVESMEELLADLGEKLTRLESLGHLIAAAHLQAAIDTLRKDFNLKHNGSIAD